MRCERCGHEELTRERLEVHQLHDPWCVSQAFEQQMNRRGYSLVGWELGQAVRPWLRALGMPLEDGPRPVPSRTDGRGWKTGGVALYAPTWAVRVLCLCLDRESTAWALKRGLDSPTWAAGLPSRRAELRAFLSQELRQNQRAPGQVS